MIQIFDAIEQGSEEWFRVRLGIPTASKFSTVMAKGKDGGGTATSVTRAKYMRELAGEIITGQPAPDTFKNEHMERGNAMEDEARERYVFINNAEITRVGFIRNGARGCSPDSLVGSNGGLEIKSAIPSIQIERYQRGELPPEHRAQVQGSLWLAERDWWDFVSDCPRMPQFQVRATRDDIYIKNLSGEIDRFNDELAAMVEWIRHYGEPSALKAQLKASLAQ